jgi:hypothetical protein
MERGLDKDQGSRLKALVKVVRRDEGAVSRGCAIPDIELHELRLDMTEKRTSVIGKKSGVVIRAEFDVRHYYSDRSASATQHAK